MTIKIFVGKPEPDLAEICDPESQSVFSGFSQRNAVTGLPRPNGKCFVLHAFALVLVLAAPVMPE
jgi:hypothetical protein